MRIFTVASALLVAGGFAFAFLTPAQTEIAPVQTIEVAKQEWSITRYKRYGNWESICETRTQKFGIQPVNLAGEAKERCFMRYIDVFSPTQAPDSRDNAATIAAFVSSDEKGLRVEFGIDASKPIQKVGVHLSREGKSVWSVEDEDCLNRGVCTFTGPAAAALVRVFSDRTADTLVMHVAYSDSNGRSGTRNWPMMPFAQALQDYQHNIRQ